MPQKYWSVSKATTVRKLTDGTGTEGSGQSKRLYIGRYGSRMYHSFLQFTENWDNVGQITSAYLVGYTDDYGIDSVFGLPDSNDVPYVKVKRLTSSFAENNAPDGEWQANDYTWPSATDSDAVVSRPSRAAVELFRIDITEIIEDIGPTNVKRHDTGTCSNVANYGIGLYGRNDINWNWSFYSDKFGTANLRPQIELNYEYGKTTPDTPTSLSPSGAQVSLASFQGNFTDLDSNDKLYSSQVQVYGPAHDTTGASTDNYVNHAAHGLVNGDIIYFVSLTGGEGELSTFTKYYVVQAATDKFKVSTSLGGTAINIITAYTDADWAELLYDKTLVASSTERTNGIFDHVPDITFPINTNLRWRARVKDDEGVSSAWTALTTFSITNTAPTAPVLTPDGQTYSTLDGVLFRGGEFADPDTGDRLLAYQLQASAYGVAAAQWDDPNFILWDTGKVYVGAGATNWEREYGGAPLDAGTYYVRARVWDDHDGVSLWDYATVILDTDFEPDPELAGQAIKLRPRAPWRIVIKDMGANRGPGNVVAILENAKSVGASLMYNSPGDLHFTLPVDHPQISVIEPKQTHYSVQFYTGDGWREKFAGLMWDFDANERDVVFYGIDYLSLYDYTMDERYDPAAPDQAPPKGSKYVDKTIGYIVKTTLQYAKDLPNSPVGFISIGSIAGYVSEASAGSMAAKATIFATMVPTLQLATGLIESHRAGQDKRTRIQVRPATGGGYEVVVQDDPGVTRTNLRLRYGELVQGYRTIAFGSNWATRVNGIGRQRDGVKVNYVKGTGLLDESVWGRFARATVVTDVEDKLDLTRRVRQMAVASSMLGQSMGLGLRSGMMGPRDGYDVTDLFPVSIQHGAVNTDNFGHDGLWVCLGVTWNATDQGNQSVILTLRPPEGGSAPATSLLDSLEISPQAEWQVGWTSPDAIAATSKYWLDQSTGIVYINNGYGEPVAITGTA